jgi:hypothetical protein
MLPQDLLGLPSRLSGLANSPSPSLTSANTSPLQSETDSNTANLLDSFLKQVSSQIQKPFTKLSEAYPHSSKTAQQVQEALALWINETISGINTGGPETPDNF